MKKNKQTIAAISTPPGIGGVGLVRLSGPHAFSIAEKIFHRVSEDPWKPNQLYYGFIQNPDTQENIDDGYAAFFKSPHSFTGEDVIEFQLHGNPFLLSSVIELCLKQDARLAEAGEFTKRAYLHGKMDLLQAEAVAELIHSQSIQEVKRARNRLDGKLSSHLETMREEVIDILAEIEADVDFPEEKIDVQSQEKILQRIQSLEQTAKQLLSTYQQNQKIHSGYRVVLVGKPNVGKSSLFNALLQHDRAIVTPHAGTTRDVLSEEIMLDGHRVKLLDTAGLRKEFSDEIEKEGIVRSGFEIAKADLILWLMSTTDANTENEWTSLEGIGKEKCWLVWNKIDLQLAHTLEKKHFDMSFDISARTGEGVDKILEQLRIRVRKDSLDEFGGGISNDRQKELLTEILQSFSKSANMIRDQQPPELTAAEFRGAYHGLNRLLGKEEDMESIYDRIFSKFCVGK